MSIYQAPSMNVPTAAPRDQRLDFFRGLAMFIILLAHTPGNTWTLWIPARFGFSDATEIFVFCSGMASAIAFGRVFVQRSWWMGSARIAFRVWQVYWAHIGIFLATVTMLSIIDQTGIGLEGKRYITSPYVVPFFERTGEALVGLMTLSYVPGLFDILPMYLAILAMVPLVMALHRVGGRAAVFTFVLATWAAANLAGYAWNADQISEPSALQAMMISAGERLSWMNFSNNPWGQGTWFFNPFGWQIIFFTGFAFGVGWLPAPPVDRRLMIAAAVFVVVSVPFAWFKIHKGLYLPGDWAMQNWVADARSFAEPLWWKSWQGLFRYLHFLSLAYLAWAAVGPGGVRLSEGFRPPRAAGAPLVAASVVVLLLTAPYAYVNEIKALAPALDRWLFETVLTVPGSRIGLAQLAHLAALLVIAWAAIGETGRNWVTRAAFVRVVPVVRKVGTQSLAVFMVSIVLARFNGWVLDIIGRDVWTRAAVNLSGFGVLIAVAYVVSWFKRQPWRSGQAKVSAPQGAQSKDEPELPGAGAPEPALRR